MSSESPMYCVNCGYDLRLLPGSRCPECGVAFDPANPSTFASSPGEHRVRLWFRHVTSPWLIVPVIWGTYWLAPFGIVVVPLLIVSVAACTLQRRWLSSLVIVVLSPLTLHFGCGVSDYFQSTGYLRYMGYPSVESGNIDPVYRCEWHTGGCVVRGTESLRNVPYNAALRLMISAFGPMRGSYTGPYPTKEEAFAALRAAQQVPVRQVINEQITLGETTFTLQPGLARELLWQTEWVLAWDEDNEDLFGDELSELGPVTGALFKGRCLLLRIPSKVCCGGNQDGLACARIALIDTVTGKLVAYYGESGYSCSSSVFWRK